MEKLIWAIIGAGLMYLAYCLASDSEHTDGEEEYRTDRSETDDYLPYC